MSMLKMAVGAKIWRSAAQPRRSLRCGQSVPMECMLPRCVQAMFAMRRLSSGLDDVNDPVFRAAVNAGRAVTDGASARPVTST